MPSDPGLAALGSSFTAITLAELGDKTFFVALLLAARHRGRWVFLGSFGALALVTVISLALGYGLRQLLPPNLVPWLAALLFGGFGFKLLIDAQAMGAEAGAEEAEEAGADRVQTGELFPVSEQAGTALDLASGTDHCVDPVELFGGQVHGHAQLAQIAVGTGDFDGG